MFHPLSLLIPLAVLWPNFLFFLTQPKNAPAQEPETAVIKFLTIFERVGQMGVFILPGFSAFSLSSTQEIIAFGVMLLTTVLYYYGWAKYFLNKCEWKFLVSPYLGIPIPMATCPVVYFLSASVVLGSSYMLIAAVLLGIGHIPITFHAYQRSLQL